MNLQKINNKSSYIKSIIQLATETLIAQIITIVVAPITTRLYTPEEIGVYTLIISIISIFGPIINGRYDFSIVYAKNEEDEKS